jgi:hypothetical protein
VVKPAAAQVQESTAYSFHLWRAGLIRINGVSVRLYDQPGREDEKNDSFDIQGEETAEYRLTQLGETDPDGRWRIRADDKELLFQIATAKDWGGVDTLLSLDSAGVTVHKPLDDRLDLLEQLHLEQQETAKLLAELFD